MHFFFSLILYWLGLSGGKLWLGWIILFLVFGQRNLLCTKELELATGKKSILQCLITLFIMWNVVNMFNGGKYMDMKTI